MPTAVALYDVVLALHVMAVVVALGGMFLYPAILAVAARTEPAHRATVHEVHARYGRTLAPYGLLVVVLAGAYLATDRELWGEPWVSGPLAIAIVIGGIGGGFMAPRERRLVELAPRDDDEYRAVLRQVRAAALGVSALVLVAIFLMVTKLGA